MSSPLDGTGTQYDYGRVVERWHRCHWWNDEQVRIADRLWEEGAGGALYARPVVNGRVCTDEEYVAAYNEWAAACAAAGLPYPPDLIPLGGEEVKSPVSMLRGLQPGAGPVPMRPDDGGTNDE